MLKFQIIVKKKKNEKNNIIKNENLYLYILKIPTLQKSYRKIVPFSSKRLKLNIFIYLGVTHQNSKCPV